MEYTYTDLLAYFLIYSFLGWVIEVCVISIRTKRFCNRGFFNLPFCPSYGLTMDILLIGIPTLHSNYLIQGIMILVVSSAIEFLSGALSKRISRKTLWKYDKNNLFGGTVKGFLLALVMAGVYVLMIYLIHPLIFMAVSLIPVIAVRIVCSVVAGLLVLDFLSILFAIHKQKNIADMDEYRKKHQKRKQNLGERICYHIWARIEKAYPNMEVMEELNEKTYVFAKGVCFDKLVWTFLICALAGDIIETLFCRLTGGVWMSRSSVIYGTFSIVWGIGAVLLTVILQRLAGKADRYVFLAGCFIGGAYEYLCSVFTEYFLGTTFWDYSEMPFNIGGRTNLLYCIFWGILSVVWVKLCYPRISSLIEKIPPLAGKIATWVILILMSCDALISVIVMIRYTDRIKNPASETIIEQFLDQNYPDEFVEVIWPNMKVK